MPPKIDKLRQNLQRHAELLSVAPRLKFPIHADELHDKSHCEGSGKPPHEVYDGLHPEVGKITSFCSGSCLQIAVLETGLDGFKWTLMGVYGFAPDGTPQGP